MPKRYFGQYRALFLPAVLAALCCLAGTAHAALFSRAANDLHRESQAAHAEGKYLAVLLTLPDCSGCLEMERKVFNDKQTERLFNQHFRTVRIDLSSNAPIIDPAGRSTTATALAERLRIIAAPSFAFFDGAQGTVRYRYTGTLDRSNFRRLASYVSAADYEQQPFNASPRTKQNDERLRQPLRTASLNPALPLQPDFKLQGSDGRPHALSDFRGQVVAFHVGYTQCPDICPTTLAELQAVVESLPPARRKRVQVLFATLDPERDALATLGRYVATFRPRQGRPIIALRGSPAATADLIREFALVAEKQPSASLGYSLDHTAGIFLIDANGYLRGLAPHDAPITDLRADLSRLIDEATTKP